MTTVSADNVILQQDTTQLRAWLTWLRDAFVTCGWVQTADTGQFNPATITYPGSINTYCAGYMMFKMNDALAIAGFPAIFKIEVGAGGSLGAPLMMFTIGTATNGAGAFVGTSYQMQINANIGGVAANKLHRASGANNRFVFMLWGQQYGVSSVVLTPTISMERTHNPDGSDNGDGIMVVIRANYSGPLTYHGVIQPSPLSQQGMSTVPPGLLDTSAVGASTVRGLTAGAWPLFPSSMRPTLPMMNLLSYMEGDFAQEVPVQVTHFSQPHTYLPLGRYNIAGIGRNAVTNDATAGLMRWE